MDSEAIYLSISKMLVTHLISNMGLRNTSASKKTVTVKKNCEKNRSSSSQIWSVRLKSSFPLYSLSVIGVIGYNFLMLKGLSEKAKRKENSTKLVSA